MASNELGSDVYFLPILSSPAYAHKIWPILSLKDGKNKENQHKLKTIVLFHFSHVWWVAKSRKLDRGEELQKIQVAEKWELGEKWESWRGVKKSGSWKVLRLVGAGRRLEKWERRCKLRKICLCHILKPSATLSEQQLSFTTGGWRRFQIMFEIYTLLIKFYIMYS